MKRNGDYGKEEQRMKKRLTHNLGLKILALVFSACLWLISININDPVSPSNYNVTVQLLNLKAMTNAGKYVEVLDDTDSIRVTVRASRSVFSSFSDKNIVATADLDEITQDNLVPIVITTTKTDSKIESIKADKEYVRVNVENIKKTQIPIEVQVQNNPADGYILGGTSTVQNAVIVSGPESIVSNIDRAMVEINIDRAKSDVNISLPVHLYDEEGNVVEDIKLSKSVNEVSTTASILALKEVPIDYDISGTPSEGYMITGEISSTPKTVMIAGKSSTIKNISKIDVPDAVNVTGFDSDVEVFVDIKKYLPEGTILADSQFSGRARVVAKIDKQEERDLQISTKKIKFINVPEGYTCLFKNNDDPIDVKVIGLKSVVDTINQEALNGTIDIAKMMTDEMLETLKAGNHSAELSLDLPDKVKLYDEQKIHFVIEEDE